MKMKFIIPLLSFLLIAALLGFGLSLNPRALPSTLINQTAPTIKLDNVVQKTEASFDSASLLGQRWVLNVWASWCASCKIEHPLFNALALQSSAPIIGLNYKDEPHKARQWLAQRGNPYYATPADYDGLVGINWGVVAVPETFVIDETGTVIYKHTGPVTKEIINEHILPLLAGQNHPSIATES